MPTAVRGIDKAMAILDWRSSTNELPWIFRSGMSACFRIGNVSSPIEAAPAFMYSALQATLPSIDRMETTQWLAPYPASKPPSSAPQNRTAILPGLS